MNILVYYQRSEIVIINVSLQHIKNPHT